MKTGFDLLSSDVPDEAHVDFMRKTMSILKILSKEALETSVRFATACGRHIATEQDMYYALMYEAHEFFNKDFDEEFFTELEKEREHTYMTDDEDESDQDSDERDEQESGSDEQNEEEEYTTECVRDDDREFHEKVLQYAAGWRDWFPDDPALQILKNAVDKTQEELSDD